MRKCTVCGKGYKASFTRSHSMRKTKVKLLPNIQWMKVEHGQRVRACTKCIRTRSKKLAVSAAA